MASSGIPTSNRVAVRERCWSEIASVHGYWPVPPDANTAISPKTTQIGENGVFIFSNPRQQPVAAERASSSPGIVDRGDYLTIEKAILG